MHYYAQRQGTWMHPSGLRLTGLYSGHGDGVNNPALQPVQGVGPIPQGMWKINAPIKSQHTGPFALPLIPFASTETFGRGIAEPFEMHGDWVGHEGQRLASCGCVISALEGRESVWSIAGAGDNLVTVVADEADFPAEVC